jgi:hypothetical protein
MGCSYVSGLAGCSVKAKVVHVIVGLMDGGAESVLARLCIHSQRWIGISALPKN